MDFKDQVFQLAERIEKVKDSIFTEEATKTAMVMPMLQILGYDVFDPSEVIPEFTCDVGTKKGERIDYAICKDGTPLFLIECKPWTSTLDKHGNQLFRYFTTSKARYCILTNGVEYRFYSDIEKPNIMDDEPFFVYRIDQASVPAVEELKKFHKSYFDGDSVSLWAGQLKSSNTIKEVLLKEFSEPSENFCRVIIKQFYDKTVSSKMTEMYSPLIKNVIRQIINDTISNRLSKAAKEDSEQSGDKQNNDKDESAQTEQNDEERIVTTQEELEAFYIVRSILRPYISPSRVVSRDTISYFGVLLDDNNRKPICRLHLNRAKKYIGIFDANKKETRFEIKTIDDIYQYENDLVKTIKFWDDAGKEENAEKKS